ncbi:MULTISPECIES: phospholipase effector Tle1 domain-containing protein [Bradyrhizobium]|uniref:DUF2235 domain-containing protein n=2 Tax=Bradyrhizobium TaxID=374 RepID=A0A5P6PEV9_9BRAD|nr:MULTISPECIES: DUF2235 domain-containing protein [Bradyrhizobium]MCS3726117.1 uncharacterized protein (DUF2235 family) [Bradyrhizobium betae]QFI76801.1 DUF2235 domain-containing protein [Bradyrhizobium betae]
MSKNIVVYSDGTGQDGGARPEQRISNIFKMYRVSRDHADTAIDPSKQVVFYDAGLGTDIGATALTAPVRFVQKMLGSIAGDGIKRNIADCYEFVVNHYEDGDRIFLFGFSRGAYTVRSLANLLMLCGVPTKTPAGPLMRYRKAVKDIAWEAVDTVLEHGAGHPREQFEAERLELARRFQTKYGSGDGSDANAAAYFVGVFDTVAALGASGPRRRMIQAGLTLGVAALAFFASLVPAAILGALTAIVSEAGLLWGFIVPAWLVTHLAMLIAVIWFWKRQRTVNLKTIYDFPNKGDPPRSHTAEWTGKNFDRLLSKHVRFARSANAIDETRKDFARVGWGGTEPSVHPATPGVPRLIQLWFAGNHSDIGGSYPEPESRLSDIALAWMCEQATSIPDGLMTGPIYVDGIRMPKTGDNGPALNVFPGANGVQHCEIAGMRDTLDAYAASLPKWRWLQNLVGTRNWEVEVREINHQAPVHPTVRTRFDLPEVRQCAGVGAYRPSALASHDDFKRYYPQVESTAQSTGPA